MISYDLNGKTALVTGGASGIGFATARMLAKFGATVAVNYLADDPRGPEAVDKLCAEGGKAIGAPGSVGEQGTAERMVLQAMDDLGRLDLLFNNAGTPGTRRRITPPELDLITEELWSQLLETNLLGRVSLFQGGGAGAEGGAWGDCEHRLDRRARTCGFQPGVQRNQGRRGQPDAEFGSCSGAGGAGERDRARRGGQFLDGGMDQ